MIPAPCSCIACVPDCSCGQTWPGMTRVFSCFARDSLIPPPSPPVGGLVFTRMHGMAQGSYTKGCYFVHIEFGGLECSVKLFSVSMKPGLILPVFLSPSVRVNFFSRSVFFTSHWPIRQEKIPSQEYNLVYWLTRHVFIYFFDVRRGNSPNVLWMLM